MKAPGLNLHLYPSPMTHETRILKTTASIEQAGLFDAIHLVGLLQHSLAESESLGGSRMVWRVPLRIPRLVPRLKTLIFFGEWYGRVLWRYRSQRVPVIQCHSIYDLPLGTLLARFGRGRKLIYDAHELETERNGLTGWRQRLARSVERFLMPHVDQVFAVSPSIVAWYQRRYPFCRVALVRNRPGPVSHAPRSVPSIDLRQRFGIEEGTLFLYLGALTPGRGVELLLEVFEKTAPDRHIVFMGYGPAAARIQECAARHLNIHFHPPVTPAEVLDVASSADVGISIVENTCLSYHYALPNKLYEYIRAGLAVVVSDNPDMRAEVDAFGNGWVIETTVEALRSLVERLTPAEILEKKRASAAASPQVAWEPEAARILAAYDRLLEASA